LSSTDVTVIAANCNGAPVNVADKCGNQGWLAYLIIIPVCVLSTETLYLPSSMVARLDEYSYYMTEIIQSTVTLGHNRLPLNERPMRPHN